MELDKKEFTVMQASENECLEYARLNDKIDDLIERRQFKQAETMQEKSIFRLTLSSLPRDCNFTCPNYCFTCADGKGEKKGLNFHQTIDAIEQARKLGARVVVWSGEGEPTFFPTFWKTAKYLERQKIPSVLFTNGSVFVNNILAMKKVGVASDCLVETVKQLHYLHVYVKYWNCDQTIAMKMVGTRQYPYDQKEKIPLSLKMLLNVLPAERIGAQITVSRENYPALPEMLEIVKEFRIYCYINSVIYRGNALDKQDILALTLQEQIKIAPIISGGGESCKGRLTREIIVRGTKLAPGVAILPRDDDSILATDGSIKDLFQIFHNEYFREMRRQSENLICLCRQYQMLK